MAQTTFPRNQAPGDRVAPTLVPGGGRQRRWSLALVAVLVTLGSALAFVVLWMNAGGRHPVLALANDVVAGQVIRDDDLTVVRVATDEGITPVAASARDQVVGQPAAADLLAGTLLVPSAVGSNDGLETGKSQIGIPVSRERMPSGDLERGDTVTIVRTGGQSEDAAPDTIGSARVFDVQVGDDSSANIRVSVVIDSELALQVAAAVDADQIYLVKTNG
jgi:hypothetical protein